MQGFDPMPAAAVKHTMAANSGAHRRGYIPPVKITAVAIADLLAGIRRDKLEERQLDLLKDASARKEALVFYAGDLTLLNSPAVSIVGTRDVTDDGWKRAAKLARLLAARGVTIVSGLAKGVDTAALSSAIKAGGRCAAVIGTPLDKAYPAENAELQRGIYLNHLLLSPFKVGDRVFRSNFPVRNRIMAAISDATVIIEASDTSGTLHQASECVRLNRWLFIAKSVVEDPALTWPARFMSYERTAVLEDVEDIFQRVLR